jgi:hypothetical protein
VSGPRTSACSGLRPAGLPLKPGRYAPRAGVSARSVGCRAAKLGTRRRCRPGGSARPANRRSLRACSAARQEAANGGGFGRSVGSSVSARVGLSRSRSNRQSLSRSSARVRPVVPGSGVRSVSLGTTLPCSGRAPTVCPHESTIHDFHSSTGTARAAEGTVRRMALD